MFWFRLALAFGVPVRVLQRQMDSREFAEWMAYSRIEPIGDKRGDYQAALIASTTHNAVASAFGGKSVNMNEFVLTFGPPRKQTPEEMRARILFAIGKKKRKRKK
jgi:hypothetical protein